MILVPAVRLIILYIFIWLKLVRLVCAYDFADFIYLLAYVLLPVRLDTLLPSLGLSLLQIDSVYYVAGGTEEKHARNVHVNHLFKSAGSPHIDGIFSNLNLELRGDSVVELSFEGDTLFKLSLFVQVLL
jgi:hypothetical protein